MLLNGFVRDLLLFPLMSMPSSLQVNDVLYIFCAVSAAVYSLVETAKANGLDVFLYLQELLANMTDWDHTDEYLEDVMPWSEFTRSQCCR